jgi:hypothetical protein
MFSAGNPGFETSRSWRPRNSLRGTRHRRRFRPGRIWDDLLLEPRLTPSTLDLTSGALTYTAADGEVNRLTVDVIQSRGVDYIRFRESAAVTIEATGKGLVVDSAQEVLAPSGSVTSLEITTGDQDDTLNLFLTSGLPQTMTISTGPAVSGDSVAVFGTTGDDAIGLAPGRLADGTKAVLLTEGSGAATIAVVGTLTVDLSQNGNDSISVDRAITGYGHEVNLNIVGGGNQPDTLSVVSPGTVPQTMTLTDGQIRADNAQTGSELFLGRSDNIAIDQPKVTIEVIDSQNGDASLGPATFSTFLLDTGATSVLVAAEATGELEQAGQDQGIPLRKYGIQYDEQGVAGTNLWDVSMPYRVDYAGYSGVRHTLNGNQFLTSEDNSFSFLGPWGIMGMPGMVGQVVNLDMTPWSTLQDPEDLSLKVDFSSDLPAPTVHDYSVPLHLQDFPADGQLPGGPIPTMAPLPFVHVKMQDGGSRTEGNFLVDTGAQLSMISTATAFALGLDRNHDGSLEDEALDHIDVGGVGGTVSVPLLAVDRASITTDQGPDMVWTDLLVGVLDISVPSVPPIDGIFGMDYLTSGWAAKVLPPLEGLPGADEDGYFQHISFDFRDAANYTGSIIFDVTPSRDVITSPQLSTLNLSYTNINTVSVATGSADDTFNVTPSTTIHYTIDGGGQVQGDRLNLVPGPYTVQDDGSTAQIDGYQNIQYSSIESKNYGATAFAIGDPGFEQVVVGAGNFRYRPTGSPWTFTGGAGISGNNSGFTSGNPAAPQGVQVAFLQGTGSFSEVVDGWAAGSYTLTFSAAQRGNHQASRQDFRVLVDGTVVGTFTPSGTPYQSLSTSAFTVTAGAHTVTFQGLDTAGGDNTAFIDKIAIV